MPWQVSGRSLEFCSCKMLCPCWLGPEGKPDEEWCGGAFVFDIQSGRSDSVDLGGTKAAFSARWPGNFFAGGGTARVYVDDGATADQRRELEAIFGGKKGGLLEPLFGAVISKWLPAKVCPIAIDWGEQPAVTVGDISRAKLVPLKDAAGKATKVSGAAAQAAFQMESMDLASARGGRWSDPDLQGWDADSGTLHSFNWSG
jgi:hypothetical protein